MGTLFRRTEAGHWYAQFTDETGRRIKKSTGTRHKRIAQQIMAQWELEVTKIRSGLVDREALTLASEASRALAEHLRDWQASMQARNLSDQWISENHNRLNRVATWANWITLADVSASDLEAFTLDLMKSGRYKKSDPRSLRTAGQYIQTAKTFTRWCVKTGRLPRDPLISVSKPNFQSDRRIERRMLLPAEWPWLKAAAGESACFGVSSETRPLLYEFAITTGLRSREIRALTFQNCHLSMDPPYVTLGAKSTKNSKGARQYLTRPLADELKQFGHGRPPRAPLFELCSQSNMARMLRTDLRAARDNWITELDDSEEQKRRKESDFLAVQNFAGEKLDFHSLRHTCGAWLAIRGVHPKVIQSIMRHSTITLTFDVYGHLMPGAEAGAVDTIENLLRPS